MRTIKFINSLGNEIEFNHTPPFILQGFDTSEGVNIYTSKGMNQDGVKYLGNTLDIKDITLNVAILSDTRAKLIQCRNKLDKIFNPKIGEGWIVYTDEIKERKIKCIVNKLPYWGTKSTGYEQKCLISLTANNPFWMDLQESKEEIALWKGDFEFELEFGEGGIEFGHREPSLIVNVNNEGDVECGMRVEFKALATLENPSILNVNTREYIKINKIMTAGEVISISTYFGNKKVTSTLSGIITNAFNNIDFQSTFLQLEPGDNLFRYDADTNIDNLEVSIYYQNKYLGV